MDSQNSPMQRLAASLKKAKSNIDSHYSKLGSKMLRSEEVKFADGAQEAPAGFSDWKKLMQEREEAASSVIEIKDNLDRVQALKKTEKDLSRSLADAKKKMRSAGLRFVSAFWDEYSPEQFPSFEPVYNAARSEKEACIELEERQRSIRDGAEEGKPLSKMMAQFRGTGLSAQLYYRKSRFEQSAGDALEALVADGGAGLLEEELRAAGLEQHCETFKPFMDLANEYLSVSDRIKKCGFEKQSVNAVLDAAGALENSSKRLDYLRTAIKEKDVAIDNICRAKGKDRAALFFDEKGKPLSGAEDAGTDEFGDELLEIAGLLAESAEIERQIEVLKTEAKIKKLDKTIAGHNAEIDSLKKKIESMNRRIESLEKTIGDVSSERAGFQSYLEKISVAESSEEGRDSGA